VNQKLTPYEKELRRKIRKLKKNETLCLKIIQQQIDIIDRVTEELEEFANRYNTDDIVKAEDVAIDISTVIRYIKGIV